MGDKFRIITVLMKDLTHTEKEMKELVVGRPACIEPYSASMAKHNCKTLIITKVVTLQYFHTVFHCTNLSTTSAVA